MARKDPFKRIMVYVRILEALEKRRQSEFAGAYKLPPLNEYCESILWDYAQGNLARRETSVKDVSQPTLQALFAREPKELTEEEVEMILELGRHAQQKLDSEEQLSRPRKTKSA